MAISDLIAAVLCKFSPKKVKVQSKNIETALVGYRPLYFNCWLCTGKNNFACKKTIYDRKFKIECSWCGIDNLVTISAPKK